MAETNEFKLVGTVYKIDVTDIPGKKDPTQVYKKHVFTIENNRARETKYTDKKGDERRGYGKKSEFPVVEFFNNGAAEAFSIGDFVEVSGYLSGQEWTAPDGKVRMIQRNSGTFIKFADLDAGHPTHKGKVKTDADTEVSKLREVFKAPDTDILPLDDESDLPFILTIPIAIGMLLPLANNLTL